MDTRGNLAQSQATITHFFHDVSRILVMVENLLLKESFVPLGDPAVFQDVSAAFDRSSRWLPKYVARAYVKGKKPTRAIGYCIHFGPYLEPTTAAFLEKSRLLLPFISLACLRDMQPGPLELIRRQIWDRLWDSGWWATREDQVSGPLRQYTTTMEISGFQATIVGALTDLLPIEDHAAIAERITTPLVRLFNDQDDTLRDASYLLIRP